ncbi:TolC family protein [Flavobacterium sp. HJJ]|uniref:TolC family protein n=1 Tax=Flavobacterium sp. HJJ TaxID=2783792 RepID=UPI00188A69F6|nr:TolC family protein [Flavobacterium sp. HJJ]MBF4470576.1 TolC family protein [Flavobacterium sp. HJJ]
MKKVLKINILFALLMFSINTAEAQTLQYNDVSINGSEFEFPPLKTVIDSVLKRNSMLKFRKDHIGVKESVLASERIYWTRNMGLQADGRYGTLNNFSSSENGVSNTAYSTLSTQYNYSVGVYVKFPVFDALNRKNQIKLAKFEVDEAKNMADFQEDEIRQTVIKLYQELILKQKLLLIRSKSLSDGKINMQMVEKEFRNGIVPVSEYVRITGITSNLEADYESAKSEFIITKQLLEDMAGFVFNLTKSK